MYYIHIRQSFTELVFANPPPTKQMSPNASTPILCFVGQVLSGGLRAYNNSMSIFFTYTYGIQGYVGQVPSGALCPYKGEMSSHTVNTQTQNANEVANPSR